MDLDFNNINDLDIDKGGITKKKLTKYVIIVPTVAIIITIVIIIISFYYLINGDYKKEKKEIIKNCIEGDDDLCSHCENDKCVSCNYRYEFINGTCAPTFSFKVVYETTSFNESIKIINGQYRYKIKSLELDNEYVDKDQAFENEFNFIIENPGNHTAYISFDLTQLNFLSGSFFSSVEKITYIHFSKEFNTENVTQMDELFLNFTKVKYIDIYNLNVKNLERMDNMFSGCSSLTSVKLPNSNAPHLTNLSYMFSNCESLTSIKFSKGMNYSTEKLTNLEGMFSGCKSLKSIDFSYLKTSNISNTKNMFLNCISLTSLDLSNFTTFNLDMDNMFQNCSKLSYLDISNFYTPRSYNNCITNLPSKGKIKLSTKIYNLIKNYIPKAWTVIKK